MTRTIVIGDVHGCLEELQELLRVVQYTSDDRLVFLGDLIDRGPDPVGVVRYVRELGAESVLGNHCEMHLRWRAHEDVKLVTGKRNPMRPFSELRAVQNRSFSDQDIKWMKSLPIYIALGGGFVAVHAGMKPGTLIHAQERDDMLHIRFVDKETLKPIPLGESFVPPPGSVMWTDKWDGPESIIYGHFAQPDGPIQTSKKVNPPFPVFKDVWPETVHTIGLDTGCVFGGSLSAMVTEDDFKSWNFVSVRAKRVYYTIKLI